MKIAYRIFDWQIHLLSRTLHQIYKQSAYTLIYTTQVKKEIYIIRHGETDFNRFGKVQGSGIDAPLNNSGFEQAAMFHEAYKHVAFDKVYVSGLQRTHQSVQAFTELGIETEIHTGLNEICWGFHEGKTTSSLDKVYYKWLMAEWRTGSLETPVRGGESPMEVARRQQPFISLLNQRTDERTVLICMHGRAMRILLSQLLETPLHEMDQYGHSNVCLYVLEQDNEGKYSVRRHNCTRHLEREEQLRA